MTAPGPIRFNLVAWAVSVALIAGLAGSAAAQPAPAGGACSYDPSSPAGAASCQDHLACLPEGLGRRPVMQIRTGTPGTCGRCTAAATEDERDRLCGGLKCLPNGTCQSDEPIRVPEPVWPRFHLFVTDVTVNFGDEAPSRPILSTGYLFQGAFHRVGFEADPQGGFLTTTLPRWYFDGGGLIALAGPAQNLFAQLGVTRYWPDGPLGLTTVSLGALYQRQGSSIWDPGATDENTDRLGPVVTVGLIQSLFVRASYAFALRGPLDDGVFLLSVTYMKSLVEDLLPGQLIHFVPESWR